MRNKVHRLPRPRGITGAPRPDDALQAALATIAQRDASLEEAGAEIDRLRGELDAIAALLPANPLNVPLAERIRKLLGVLADAVELLDPETPRQFPPATIAARRGRLLRLLPRLGPYRPARAA